MEAHDGPASTMVPQQETGPFPKVQQPSDLIMLTSFAPLTGSAMQINDVTNTCTGTERLSAAAHLGEVASRLAQLTGERQVDLRVPGGDVWSFRCLDTKMSSKAECEKHGRLACAGRDKFFARHD